MRAISSFSLETGTSTFWCRAPIALRMRASKSATGSVNLIMLLLGSSPVDSHSPRRLAHTRDLAAQREPAKTQAADAELAQVGARTAADMTAVVLPRGKLGLLLVVLHHLCCSCHRFLNYL